jgi:hypothetical protein
LRIADEARRPFLDAGHYLQDHVEAFVQEQNGELNLDMREAEGLIDVGGRWEMTGHIDGMFLDSNLLEVKAIKANSFEKLAKTYDFRERYGHYIPQAQMYQRMFGSPGTHFVFYNRDTSEMMGSVDITHPAYTYRKDMYVPHDVALCDALMLKFNRVCEAIEAEELPDECDAEGYCYFCGTTGNAMAQRRHKRVGLMPDDDEFNLLRGDVEKIEELRGVVGNMFIQFKADEIVLHHDDGTKESLRKEDYLD